MSEPPLSTAGSATDDPTLLRGTDPWLLDIFLSSKGVPEDELANTESWADLREALEENPMPVALLRDAIRKHIEHNQPPKPSSTDAAAMAGREARPRSGAGGPVRTAGGQTLSAAFCVRTPPRLWPRPLN
jgi:hypothetical protein